MSELYKRVSKEDFYRVIGPMDVVVSVYERETLFKTRNGKIIGRTEGYKAEENFYELLKTKEVES